MDISFEFFPPKTEEGATNLRAAHSKLQAINPAFFSVTFGAGGTTQDGTLNTVIDLKRAGSDAAPHLSCIGSTRENISKLLDTYKANNINRIVALRGDMPSGMRDAGEFRYASELVSFIREHTGDHFHIEVAAYPEMHPQAKSPADDLAKFIHKVQCGANSAITQYFFNADSFLYFRDKVRGQVDIPIVPGIMPITNYTQLARFSDACGAEIPRWIRSRLQSFGDDKEAIKAFGLEIVSRLCQQLLHEGVEGLHFYTMNAADSSLQILKNLNLARHQTT